MKTFLLIALQLAASGSDAYFTNRNAQTPLFREHNPIARPFVRTTQSRAIYFSAGAGLKIGGVLFLRKRHKRLANALALAGIADNGGAALYSATH